MSNVTFGMTAKRINSTSVTMQSSTTLNCRLKNPCSIHDPVFEVKGLSDSVRYNYLSWAGAYYWIDSVVHETNDISVVNCHLDPLATFRSSINNAYGYVELGDFNHASLFKDDYRFGPDKKKNWATAGTGVTSFDMGFDKTSWSVVMTVQCSTSTSYSSVLTYAMTVPVFCRVVKAFSATVISDIATWSASDVVDCLKNFATKIMTGGGQAMDNIRSCIMLPIPISKYASYAYATSTVINLGPYSINLDSGDSIYIISSDKSYSNNGVIDLHRPLASTTYTWLNSPKYCSIQVSHPCGYQEINEPSLLENNQLYLWWCVNLASGEYSIRITAETARTTDTIALISGSVGIDIAGYTLTAGGNNYIDNLFNGIANTLVTAGTGGIFGVETGKMSPSGSGNAIPAGFANIFNLEAGKECFVDVEYYTPSILEGTITEYANYCNEYGYIVGRYMKVGDITGFCKCRDISINNIVGATSGDKEYINNYLNNGIFIEA